MLLIRYRIFEISLIHVKIRASERLSFKFDYFQKILIQHFRFNNNNNNTKRVIQAER